ncbi:MAG TPA: hypothetical protein VF981_02460 [Gemmatimonadaceae bacterium]
MRHDASVDQDDCITLRHDDFSGLKVAYLDLVLPVHRRCPAGGGSRESKRRSQDDAVPRRHWRPGIKLRQLDRVALVSSKHHQRSFETPSSHPRSRCWK